MNYPAESHGRSEGPFRLQLNPSRSWNLGGPGCRGPTGCSRLALPPTLSARPRLWNPASAPSAAPSVGPAPHRLSRAQGN